MRIKGIIILIFVIAAVGSGFYFRNDLFKTYNNFVNRAYYEVKTDDIGTIISKVSKQFLTPPPLISERQQEHDTEPTVFSKIKIIFETNLQRQQNGDLSALKENAMLDAAALAKANDMFKNQYFEHVSPAGVDPGVLVQKYGYNYIKAGENLILGNFLSEGEMVDDWMASEGHRANILNTRYTEIGVAVISGTYEGNSVWIAVQEFGLPLSTCQTPDDNLRNQIETQKEQINTKASQIQDQRNQIDQTNPTSPKYWQMVSDYNQAIEEYNQLVMKTKTIINQYNNQINIFNQCAIGS